MERSDPQTGEVFATKMPAEIAKAIATVMGKTKQLGYDDTNKFQNYKFASIDKFLSTFGPLCAEAGLVITMDEESVEIKKAPNEKGTETGWLFTRWRFMLFHTTGVEYGPLFRTVMVPGSGAQAFGSAQSYLLKQFMRGLFMVPTGEKDADSGDSPELPQTPAQQQKAQLAQPPAQAAKTTSPAPQAPKSDQDQTDLAYAKTVYQTVRGQVAAADSIEHVDDVLKENAMGLEHLKKISPVHAKQIDDIVANRKKMLDDGEPTP